MTDAFKLRSIEDHVARLKGFVDALRLIGQGTEDAHGLEAATISIAEAMDVHLDRIVDMSFDLERSTT